MRLLEDKDAPEVKKCDMVMLFPRDTACPRHVIATPSYLGLSEWRGLIVKHVLATGIDVSCVGYGDDIESRIDMYAIDVSDYTLPFVPPPHQGELWFYEMDERTGETTRA